MSEEFLAVVLLAMVGGFIHHLYQCRKVHEKLGRIMQKLGMDEE